LGTKTAIAWTDHTFNPWMGCHKVSQGCKHCYAEALIVNRRREDLWGPDLSKRRRTGRAVWARPVTWNYEAQMIRTPAKAFCASLADMFEDAPVPNETRSDVWAMIRRTPWLDWQLLTKRPENIEKMLPDDWGPGYKNVWLGTSIEDNRVAERGPILTSIPAIVHFISYEPAIGPLDELPLAGIEWMIVGGESGPDYRPMKLMWAMDMQDRCNEEGVAFFFKQSAARRTEMGIEALGGLFRDYPESWDRSESLLRVA
jgi:protein gp37